jgi:aminoglycoside 6'-N-acetyltransferase
LKVPFPTYQFRAVTTADLPLLREWLWRRHVREWWGDPVSGLARIAEHIVDPAINPFMVECDDVPIGYIQSWDPHAEADHPCRDQPLGTRGIDQFIGEPKLVGQGHGTAFIRLFVESLFKVGAPRVITDPNPRNSRAIRAYAKAGFKEIDRRITISGEALLMARDALPSESLVSLRF